MTKTTEPSEIYIVLKNDDMIEGKGPMWPVSYWLSRDEAVASLPATGPYGGDPIKSGFWDVIARPISYRGER